MFLQFKYRERNKTFSSHDYLYKLRGDFAMFSMRKTFF